MQCHEPCGACCIAPEISSALPNMPEGKPAGVRCVNLNQDLRCSVYEQRPKVCRGFTASDYTCGNDHDEALIRLTEIESVTKPSERGFKTEISA